VSPLSRRDLLRSSGVLGLAALASPYVIHGIEGGATASATQTGPDFNVQQYGALPNGTDATPGFDQAIAAAQASTTGGTVVVPAGTYMFTSKAAGVFAASIQVHNMNAVPITILGAGSDKTFLIQQVPGQTLISLHTDGTTIDGLTLDCQMYQGGSCLGVGSVGLDVNNNAVGGNNLTLQNCTALGSDGNKSFTLYFAGPPGASQATPYYQSGNTVNNCVVHDQIDDDGFSFSFQTNGTISNITHFGSRLALFESSNTTVTDYDYTPNPACDQGNNQGYATNAFWITPPAANITITNFTTSGEGGIISGGGQERIAQNITIVNEVFTGSGFEFQVGNVEGLTFEGCDFGENTLLFNPGNPGPHSTPGLTAGVSDVTISNTVLSTVVVQTSASSNKPQNPGAPQPGPPVVEATFTDCTFTGPAADVLATPTFSSLSSKTAKGGSPLLALRWTSPIARSTATAPSPSPSRPRRCPPEIRSRSLG
jgi:hypothetical protein